jgi:hypothetical protein
MVESNDRLLNLRRAAWCCIALIAILWFVGVISSEILRHFIQTLPLWIGIALTLRGNVLGKWAMLGFLAVWFLLMTLIWITLLGFLHWKAIQGHFSAAELVMTLLIACVSLLAALFCMKAKGRAGPFAAGGIFLAALIVQVGALWVSVLPAMSRR